MTLPGNTGSFLNMNRLVTIETTEPINDPAVKAWLDHVSEVVSKEIVTRMYNLTAFGTTHPELDAAQPDH